MTTAVEWTATREAIALGHHWVGEEHLLLAVAEEVGRDRDVLAVTLANHLERFGPPIPKVHDGCVSAPSYHLTCGRAEGLALAEGVATPEPRHVLQALLADPTGVPAALLGRVDAEAPPLPPNPLLAPAEREALEMGYPFIGAEHVVLALLTGRPDDLAGRVLRQSGLDHDVVAAKLVRGWTNSLPECPPQAGVASAKPNPRCRELLGRAEGLAGGPHKVGSHHGLVAFLWCGEGHAVLELESWGTTAATIAAALTDVSVGVPTVPPPVPDRTPWGEPVFVPVDRYGDVVRALYEQLDAGTWGCNSHDERAWVHAHAHIDVQAIVDSVLTS